MPLAAGLIAALALAGSPAQDPPEPSPSPSASPRGPSPLDVPALEYPYNVPDGSFPSMRQSLMLSKDAFHLMHLLEGKLSEGEWSGLMMVALDFLYVYLPLGDAWLHEEYHRAVLSRRGISSFNDVYKMKLFAETIAVSHVRDEDLVRLKREHPAEQVRLSAAGGEGEHDLVLELEKDSFFHDSPDVILFVAWLSKLTASYYVYQCGTDAGDELTDELNLEDGADVKRRDFTGLDFTAWVYDLHRPDEPYEARGVHPSGVGIDRYRKLTHLTAAERSYLRQQGWLTWLNFVDPQLIGIRSFGRPEGIRWMASLRHELTSFGYVIDANVFLRRGGLKLAATTHAYVSQEHVLPGLDVQLLGLPVHVGGATLTLTPRLAAWLQPRDQLYRSRETTAGGLLGLRAGLGSRRVRPYLEVEAKTEGWVAGNVYLGKNVTVRAGFTALAFGKGL
jgi:hypothetical protein